MAKHKPNAETLKRNTPKKEPYDRVLIVCEDEKSATYYFEFLKNCYRLSSANIEIAGKECGSSPKSVLEYAKKRKEEEIQNKNPFDKIFCVFDRDKHERYDETVTKLKKLSNDNVWEKALINSIPCFEYWYFLHFNNKAPLFQMYPGEGGSSIAVETELKKDIPNYDKSKNDQKMFHKLYNKLPFAIKYAKQFEKNNTDNPSTKVYILVEYLQELNLPIAIKHAETLLSQAKENKTDNNTVRILEQYLKQLKEKQELKK